MPHLHSFYTPSTSNSLGAGLRTSTPGCPSEAEVNFVLISLRSINTQHFKTLPLLGRLSGPTYAQTVSKLTTKTLSYWAILLQLPSPS
jgi:hypothetical protein